MAPESQFTGSMPQSGPGCRAKIEPTHEITNFQLACLDRRGRRKSRRNGTVPARAMVYVSQKPSPENGRCCVLGLPAGLQAGSTGLQSHSYLLF